MTKRQPMGNLRMIPVDRIEVLNPRDRNKQVFEQIVENIKTVGLKKPITITPRPADDGGEKYVLVCGEGRLKAFMALGEISSKYCFEAKTFIVFLSPLLRPHYVGWAKNRCPETRRKSV